MVMGLVAKKSNTAYDCTDLYSTWYAHKLQNASAVEFRACLGSYVQHGKCTRNNGIIETHGRSQNILCNHLMSSPIGT